VSTPDPFPRPFELGVLRRLAVSDLAAFQAYRHDPEVGRYQGWSPLSDEDAVTFLASMAVAPVFEPGQWTQIGIVDAHTLALLGDIGLHLSADTLTLGIGFTLSRSAQGRGIATAAVREAIGLAFERTSIERVVGVTDTRNVASARLLHRVGMSLVASHDTVFKGARCIEDTYAVMRPGGA
jgi:aminoglycoside 6'-N-acetyltransferase